MMEGEKGRDDHRKDRVAAVKYSRDDIKSCGREQEEEKKRQAGRPEHASTVAVRSCSRSCAVALMMGAMIGSEYIVEGLHLEIFAT